MEFESLRDLRLHGFAKIFHHIFMFFTYPIRHPFKFVVFLLVLAILLFVASFCVLPDYYCCLVTKLYLTLLQLHGL